MMSLYEVACPLAPLHRKGAYKSPLETQLLRGEIFKAEKIFRHWIYGQAVSPIETSAFSGYRGYVPLKYLRPKTQEPTVIVTALSAPLFTREDIKSPVLDFLPLNARLHAAQKRGFYETEDGFLHARHVRALKRNSEDQTGRETDFVTIAERHIGRPYVWGGVSPMGLDCSGLVQASMRAVGRDIPRDAKDQSAAGHPIAPNRPLRRGDLIFWKGHVGIMQDETRLLHANAFHMMTASEPLVDATDRIGQTGGPVTHRRRLEPL